MERVEIDCFTGEEIRVPHTPVPVLAEKYAAIEAEQQRKLNLVRERAGQDPHFAALLDLLGMGGTDDNT